MEPGFHSEKYRRLFEDAQYDAGFSREVVRAFRKRMQAIEAAVDERDIRLVVAFDIRDDIKTVVIVGIEDYH